jgi:XTP/dITP diphosphohydrolase
LNKKIILATSNKGKVIEIRALLPDFEIIPYCAILEPFEIVEDGASFKENAIIKARAVYERLSDKNIIVIADDSGISVPALGGEPGIYSARYVGEGASDRQNLDALIVKLKAAGIAKTPAFYTACIAMADKNGILTTHGWMHGDVIDEARGDGGFGYDPSFVPLGYEQTLGELPSEVKKSFSHRSRALSLAKMLIKAAR